MTINTVCYFKFLWEDEMWVYPDVGSYRGSDYVGFLFAHLRFSSRSVEFIGFSELENERGL